jgi:hypothetical protein
MRAYEVLKSLIIEDRLDYYNHPIFIKEMKELVLLNNRKVDHPKGGGKDLADSTASACFHCSKELTNSPFFFSSF